MGKVAKQGGDGLRGGDQQQDALRDKQGGTYGVTPSGKDGAAEIVERRTEHQEAQHGADVRPETILTQTDLPAGLTRERKGPLNKSSGRRSLKE